jgi:hypothetical protein
MTLLLALLIQDRVGAAVGFRYQETADGIKILGVREGSPAAKVFQKDDLVIKIGKDEKPREEKFIMGLWMAKKVKLTLKRGADEVTVETSARELDATPETAPDFTLKSPDGKTEVKLSKLIGKKPVVLVFGSYT